MKQNHHLKPYSQEPENLTQAQKFLAFILFAPPIAFGLMCILALLTASFAALFPEGEMAQNYIKQQSLKEAQIEVPASQEPTIDPNCLYYPENKVPHGFSHNEFRKMIKKETGIKCFFYTSGFLKIPDGYFLPSDY